APARREIGARNVAAEVFPWARSLHSPPRQCVPDAKTHSASHGQVNRAQVNPQLVSPTSHCAIRSASPMLQAPSRFTSHTSGWVNGATWHCRSPTSNCATMSASPMLTAPSPFTSPHGTAGMVVVDVVLVDGVTVVFCHQLTTPGCGGESRFVFSV